MQGFLVTLTLSTGTYIRTAVPYRWSHITKYDLETRQGVAERELPAF